MLKSFIVLFLTSSLALGENFFIANTSTGSGSGVDPSNCKSVTAWMGNAANYGSIAGKMGADDNVYIVNTITTNLPVLGGGTSGHPLSIIWYDSSSKISTDQPDNGVIIYHDGVSDVNFEGFSTNNVAIEQVNTGDGLTYTNVVVGFYFKDVGSSRINYKNLRLRNLYQRVNKNTPAPGSYWFRGSGSDITITNCYISEGPTIFNMLYGGPTVLSNFTIVDTVLTNFNHGIEISAAADLGPYLNVTIDRSVLATGDMFETVGADLGLHRDPVFIWNHSTAAIPLSYVSNFIFRASKIVAGTAPSSTDAGSGAIYYEFYTPYALYDAQVYNSISVLTGNLVWNGGGGFLSVAGVRGKLFNNTSVGWQSAGNWGGSQVAMSGTNCVAYNNLILSPYGMSLANLVDTSGLVNNNATKAAMLGGNISDYNIFQYLTNANSFSTVIQTIGTGATWAQDTFSSLPTFNGAFGGLLSTQWEPHSSTNNITLDSNYTPTSAANSGTNLYAQGITTDYYGNSRSALGAFTVGAVSVTSSSVVATGGIATGKSLILGKSIIR